MIFLKIYIFFQKSEPVELKEHAFYLSQIVFKTNTKKNERDEKRTD